MKNLKKNSVEEELAYVLSGFPRLSETFILNEILKLEEEGVRLTVFSLKQSTDRSFHDELLLMKSAVIYVPEKITFRFLGQAVLSGFSLFFSAPLRFIRSSVLFLISGKKERYFSLGKSFLRWLWMSRLIQKNKIPRLHAHFAHDPTTMTYWVSHLLDYPYSFTAHAKDIYCYSEAWLQEKIHHAQFVVTCTEHNKTYIESIAKNGTPIHCIHHGVNLTKFSPNSKVPNEKLHLLSVGRLIPKKGFTVLLDACSILKNLKIEFECQIVGEGPMLAALQDKVKSLGLKNHVHFLGSLTHHILVPLYQAADVFVLPCKIMDNGDQDGVPNVILEAMAMKLPVVSTRIAGIPEAIDHGSTGYLVAQNSAQEVADAVKAILYNPDLSKKMGENARLKVQQTFELQKNVSELRGLLAA